VKGVNVKYLVSLVPLAALFGCSMPSSGGTAVLQVLQGTNVIATGGTYDFGGVALGSHSVLVTFSIKNTGTAAASLAGQSALSVTGAEAADFTISTQPSLSIAAGTSTSFALVFSPSVASTESVQISLSSVVGTFTFTLTGTGLAAVLQVLLGTTPIASGGTYGFSNVQQGTQSAQIIFTIKNSGTQLATLSGGGPVSISGTNAGDFQVSSQASTTIAGGASTTFSVVFSPLTNSAETAQAQFTSQLGTYTINLNGTGTSGGSLQVSYIGVNGSPVIIPNKGTMSFGSLAGPAGNTTSVTFTIANADVKVPLALVGVSPLTITNNTLAFSITTSPASPVAPNGSTTFVVQEVYIKTGSYPETVTLQTSDASNQIFTFTVNGPQS
jgi:hypothetical protein